MNRVLIQVVYCNDAWQVELDGELLAGFTLRSHATAEALRRAAEVARQGASARVVCYDQDGMVVEKVDFDGERSTSPSVNARHSA